MANLDIMTPLLQGLQARQLIDQRNAKQAAAQKTAQEDEIAKKLIAAGPENFRDSAEYAQLGELNTERLKEIDTMLGNIGEARVKDMITAASRAKFYLDNNRPDVATQFFGTRLQNLKKTNRNAAETEEIYNDLSSGRVGDAKLKIESFLNTVSKSPKFDFYAPEVDPQTGQMFVTKVDKQTGQAERINIQGAFGQTPEQKSQMAIAEAQGVKKAELGEKRTSDFATVMNEQTKLANATLADVEKAMIAAEKATQGLVGEAKVALSSLGLPIDVTDEAQLDAATKEITLKNLQAFKGPTTDFELNYAADIGGSLGSGKSANIARLNAMKRAVWFKKQEDNQWRAHQKAGGTADDFRFNFEAMIKTKKGEFTLQDLQETAVHNNMSVEDVLRKLNANN